MTYQDKQRLPNWVPILLIMSTVFSLVIVTVTSLKELKLFFAGHPDSEKGQTVLMVVIGMILFYVVLYFVLLRPALRVRIDPVGVHYMLFPYLRREKSVRWTEIRKIKLIDVDPLGDFGGYGYRMTFKGKRGYVMRPGKGIEIERLNSPKKFVLTVADGVSAEQAIRKYGKKD